MAEESGVLTTLYRGWADYQGHLVRAIGSLSQAELSLAAAPHLRPIGVLAAHIIAARVYWIDRKLGEGEAEIAPLVHWDDPGAPARSAAELVSGLEATWRMVEGARTRWTAEDMSRPVQVRRGGREHTVTRQWVVWHLIEHDLHHGGELAFSMGIHHLAAHEI